MFYSIPRLFIYSLIFLMLIVINAAPTFAQADDFLWKWSKGRGAGTTPALTCHNGRDQVGELCYDKCKSGYHVNGTNKLRCTPPSPRGTSYEAGGGIAPNIHGKCKSNRSKIGGLCYTHCIDGYKRDDFAVTRCKRIAKGYDRKPFAKENTCARDKVLTEGLCYTPCPKGTKGKGPVCWANIPKGWVDCGAGMATSMKAGGKTIFNAKTNCAIITAGQVWSVAEVALFACKAAGTPACGAPTTVEKALLAKDFGPVEGEVMRYGQKVYNMAVPVMNKIAKMFLPSADNVAAAARQKALLKEAQNLSEVAELLTSFQKAMLAKNVVSGTNKATSILSRFSFTKNYKSTSGQLALLRDTATLASIFITVGQMTGKLPPDDLRYDAALATFGVIASFAYPTSGS